MSLVTTVVLARLLKPGDFGLLGMATVITGFIMLFRDLGTSSAIIQKKEISEELLSSIYWVNVAFGTFTTLFLFSISQIMATFYKAPEIKPILQALSITFFLSGISILHQALLERELAFKKLARLEIFSSLVGSLVGIGSALLGYGVWSLVYQTISVTFITTIFLWIAKPWRPRLFFGPQQIKSVFSYSINLAGFNIINYFSRNADYMIIGRFLGAQELGYYTLAYKILLYPLHSISAVIGRVMFPLYSNLQNNNERFSKAYLSVAGTIAIATFPMMLGIMATGHSFIKSIFGPQWMPAITPLIILAPVGMAQSVGTTVGAIYQAKGRTDWMLRWGIGSSILIVLAFFIGINWGIIGVAASYAIATFIIIYPSFSIPFKLVGLSMRDLGRVLMRPFAASIFMYAHLFLIKMILPGIWPDGLKLTVMILTGVIIYLISSWMLNKREVLNILELAGVRN